MALRRPPTRVELKTDDIDEYRQIMKEREMEDSNVNMLDGSTSTPRGQRHASNKRSMSQSKADRIGLTRLPGTGKGR
eukprot:Nitzschia sp. Nitz4//scaffold165_size50357//16221//16636//NITZ4_007018-RA/size50357-augustus-gene-0.25-mRNA-1//-1//CDS//3329538123//9415//frame0